MILTKEEYCYNDLRDRLIDHGENAFIYHVERQYKDYVESQEEEENESKWINC